MKASIDLSIVIVNWKVADLVADLLRSIGDETHGISYEVLVVDNDSKDRIEALVQAFRARHPHLRVECLLNDRNKGFAAACNQGIRVSQGRYVVLLNPDTVVKDGALQKMVAWMDAHPDVGVAGPRLLNADGTLQPSVRRLPMLLDQTLILLKLHRLLPSLPAVKRYLASDFDYDKEQDAEQVMGAAFFTRRTMFEEVGLLDERFFIWFEEVDFCKRVRDAGFRVAFVPSATVMHRGGQSFAKELTLKKQRYFTDSLLKYFRKHRGAAAAIILAVPALIGLGFASVLSLRHWLKDKR